MIALGTMNFGGRTNEETSRRIVARALERGIEWFDTANAYGDGTSERILGRALSSVRDRVKIATKVGLLRRKGRAEGLAPERVLEALDESLDRLGTDRIDLYYLHAPDRAVPIGETLDALRRAFEAGKLRAWGVSNFASWRVLEAKNEALRIGLPPPSHAQQLHNLLVRQLEIEWFDYARSHPIHTTVYNALAGGLLTGRHRLDQKPEKGSRFDNNRMYLDRYWSERFFALTAAYAEVARDEDRSLPSLAHGWLASRPGVDSVLLGPATVEQLDDALDACARPPSEAAVRRIDEIHLSAQGTDARYAR